MDELLFFVTSRNDFWTGDGQHDSNENGGNDAVHIFSAPVATWGEPSYHERVEDAWGTILGPMVTNFLVLCSVAKVFPMECHFGFEDAGGQTIIHLYKAMLVEVGLYGNPFSHNYKKWQGLPTDNMWFKNFWQYVDHLQIEVCLYKEYHTKPIHEGGVSLMESFIQDGYASKHLLHLNQVRKNRKLIHLSDVIKYDRISVEDGFLGNAIEVSRKYIFPLE